MNSELSNNPAKSTDPEVLRKYFIETLGFSPEEAEPMVRNWSRTNLQSMEEVREGVLWEREGREILTDARMERLSQIGEAQDSRERGD